MIRQLLRFVFHRRKIPGFDWWMLTITDEKGDTREFMYVLPALRATIQRHLSALEAAHADPNDPASPSDRGGAPGSGGPDDQ